MWDQTQTDILSSPSLAIVLVVCCRVNLIRLNVRKRSVLITLNKVIDRMWNPYLEDKRLRTNYKDER